MKSTRSNAGGGMGSKVVTTATYHTGKPAMEKRAQGVSQIGRALGNKAEMTNKKLNPAEPIRGSALPSVKLGNELAESVTRGPGGGRTVMKSGSQQGLDMNPTRFKSPGHLD
jgi:hypothetical protein